MIKEEGCFCKCKDTKLKAIHNQRRMGYRLRRCFCKCKDTKLKAIHNSY